MFRWSTPFGSSQFPQATKFRLRFSIKGLHFQMCEILQILTLSSIRTGEEIGMIGFKWLKLGEEKWLKIENCRLEFTLSSIRRGEEIGTIRFKWLGLWEEKRLKIENCRSEFGIKGFWNEIREIVEKYTRFSVSPWWQSEERWEKWVSNERKGRKNRRLWCFCGKLKILFWSFQPI